MTEQAPFLPMIADGEDKTSPLRTELEKTTGMYGNGPIRTETNCFRIYDRDIKEYPLAIDFYHGRFCVHYFSDTNENDEPRQDLYDAATSAICSIFGVKDDCIFWRTRIKREKTQQYEKMHESKAFFIVLEYGVKFRVNLRRLSRHRTFSRSSRDASVGCFDVQWQAIAQSLCLYVFF